MKCLRSSPLMPSSFAAQSRQRYGAWMIGLYGFPAIAAFCSWICSRSSRNFKNITHVNIGKRSMSPFSPLSFRMMSRADLMRLPSCWVVVRGCFVLVLLGTCLAPEIVNSFCKVFGDSSVHVFRERERHADTFGQLLEFI